MHVVFALNAWLLFVTKHRRGVLDADIPRPCQDARGKMRGGSCTKLHEFNGEDDYLHLLAAYPPKVAIPALVKSLKGRSGPAVASGVHRPRERAYHARPLLVPGRTSPCHAPALR